LPMQYSCAIAERMSAMTPDQFEDMRHAMVVSQLRPDGVTDPRVIDAMATVPREDYVPEDRRSTAYADRLIPMSDGRGINPPMVTGRLLSEARVAAGEHVLIIGSAAGYTAAVVAMLTDSVTIADAGAPIKGTFDVIMIDGAVEHVPDAVVDHLAANGRLITGIVESGVTRLAIGRRGGSGFGLVAFMDAEMVVLPEFSRPHAFVF
jgi:protein-L-isoaspartate(D-aspartate) O-methyltransferase